MNDSTDPNQDQSYSEVRPEVENLSAGPSGFDDEAPASNDQLDSAQDEHQLDQKLDNDESEPGHQFQDYDDNQETGPSEFSWNASEFIHHQKKPMWYFLFGLIVLVLIVITILTRQWFSSALFVVMALALAVYANKEPRVLSYHLGSSGITIDQKLYHYNQFRSFAIFNDVAWHSIDLDPLQRFQPRLTVMFESKDLPHIESILSTHLPHIDREPDYVERLTRFLKF